MKIGLKIDVDTLRGTKEGVIPILRLLSKYAIQASFFFSVGPDNMGRHLRRLFNPFFAMKMLRSKASSLYGWGILLKGTFWPGPLIGPQCISIIRSAEKEGHEIGLHAWDHHAWQSKALKSGVPFMEEQIKKGYDFLADILDAPPFCSAAPAWKCNADVLQVKSRFPFKYLSDTRGHSVFLPVTRWHTARIPQIPTTLPTYDEIIGTAGVTDENYNNHVFSLLKPESLNVLTIHAEAEGISKAGLFEKFIQLVKSNNAAFLPLGSFLENCKYIPFHSLDQSQIKGRPGWTACQGERKIVEEAGERI